MKILTIAAFKQIVFELFKNQHLRSQNSFKLSESYSFQIKSNDSYFYKHGLFKIFRGFARHFIGLVVSRAIDKTKALRTITYNDFRCHISPSYKSLNFLKLRHLYRFELVKLMHKYHHGSLPTPFKRPVSENG